MSKLVSARHGAKFSWSTFYSRNHLLILFTAYYNEGKIKYLLVCNGNLNENFNFKLLYKIKTPGHNHLKICSTNGNLFGHQNSSSSFTVDYLDGRCFYCLKLLFKKRSIIFLIKLLVIPIYCLFKMFCLALKIAKIPYALQAKGIFINY